MRLVILSGEALESPDKTGNYMCLSGETSVSPDKAILKGKLGVGREVACLRHVRSSVILQIAFRVMCHRTV